MKLLRTRVQIVFCVFALAACDAGVMEAPPDSGPAADAGTPPPLPLPFYEVPVDDAALAPHAFFAVPDVHYVTSGGTVTLTYDFPPELSGVVDQEVVLSGPVDASGNATVSGPVGSGTCMVEAGIVRCLEHFTGLPIDAGAASELAATYSTSPDLVDLRRAVLDRFAADPIGIVVFDRATASEPTD